MEIPKIIHQIWLGPNKRPDIWTNSWKIDYIKKYPDWEYKLWTEKEINELDLINNKQYKHEQFYNGKSDIARYEILNKFGGIFIDADSLWINHSLDDILNKSKDSGMFCAEEPVNKWSIANGVIGFTKDHIILKEIIDHITNNYFNLKKKLKKEKDIWRVTGTEPFTKIVKNFKNTLILESYYFYPESFHKNNLSLDSQNFKNMYPNSIMFQYGYTTNNILHNNIMKNHIDKI
jgi:mannosyltransferase OCH1-like enzyme